MSKVTLFARVDTSDAILFGSKTRVGAGGKPVPIADGTYGEFTVSGGIISPNTTPLTVGPVSPGGVAVVVEAGYATVSPSDAIDVTASALRASGVPETIKLRNGIYRTIPFIQSFTPSNRITLTWQETLGGPVFYNVAQGLRASSNSTWDGLSFRASPEFAESLRPPTDTGVFAVSLWKDQGDNIHVRNCFFDGQAQTDEYLNDSTWTYPDGGAAHVPAALDFSNAAGTVVEDNVFRNVNSTIFVHLSDGTIIRRNHCHNVFSEGLLLGIGNKTNGGTCLIEDHTVENVYGIYEETDDGGGAPANHPHMDSIQTVPLGGQTPVAPVEVVLRRFASMRGNNRAGSVRGLSAGGGLQGSLFQTNGGVSRVVFDTCAFEIAASHGNEDTGAHPIIFANCTFVFANDAAQNLPNLRVVTTLNGKEYVLFNTLFQGRLELLNARDDAATVELINSEFEFDVSLLTSPPNSNTLAQMKAALTPQSGQLVGKGAFVDGDWRPLAGGFPRPAAAPAVVDNGNGTVTVTRAVPDNLDGATVATYELRHRVSANNAVWTHVEDISAPEVVALAAGTYEFQTRPRTTAGAPGFWSAVATETVV